MDGLQGYTTSNYENSTIKALVVDDSRAYAKLVALQLSRAGIGAIAFYDPRVALQYARSHPDFDIAILDLEMPGMKGSELERELRSIPGKRELKVIIPTANQDAIRNYDSERLCRRGEKRTKVLNKIAFSENPKQHIDDVLAA